MMDNMIAVETPEQFGDEVIRADSAVVVVFFAEWDPNCKRLGAALSQLAEDYGGRIRFVKVDVDRAPELDQEWEIKGIPTVILFVDHVAVNRWLNEQGISIYKDELDAILAKEGV